MWLVEVTGDLSHTDGRWLFCSSLGNHGQCHNPSKLQSRCGRERVVVFPSQGIPKTSSVGEGAATVDLHK